MAVRINANRGDIAEGIMGAALTAKFIKREMGQHMPMVTRVVKYWPLGPDQLEIPQSDQIR